MLNNDAEVARWAGVPADRYKVVSGIVEHPLRPGIVGQVALWPMGVYTLLAANGHTHYAIPQEWAAAQVEPLHRSEIPEVAHD